METDIRIKMIVLHYIPDVDNASGGTGSYMQILAGELGKLVELHIATHHSKHELLLENCHLHFLSRNYHALSEFQELLSEIKPDIIQTNTCWLPMASIVVEKAKKNHIPVIYCPHGMLEPWIMKRHHWMKKVPALFLYQKKALQTSDVLLATAESEKQNLLKLNYNKHIEVLPNCVDTNKIEIKKNWKKTHTILFLSRIHPKKGINFLFEAIALSKKALKDYKIIIAGDGEKSYIQELHRQSERLEMNEYIEFVGGIYGTPKWELYRNADVMILPTYSENFGISIAEALACGTPVITTKGTPWQDLETRNCGWWTEIGTNATTDALQSFLQCSEQELEIMGRNGRKLVEEKYSSNMIAKQMMELYKNVISTTYTR